MVAEALPAHVSEGVDLAVGGGASREGFAMFHEGVEMFRGGRRDLFVGGGLRNFSWRALRFLCGALPSVHTCVREGVGLVVGVLLAVGRRTRGGRRDFKIINRKCLSFEKSAIFGGNVLKKYGGRSNLHNAPPETVAKRDSQTLNRNRGSVHDFRSSNLSSLH